MQKTVLKKSIIRTIITQILPWKPKWDNSNKMALLSLKLISDKFRLQWLHWKIYMFINGSVAFCASWWSPGNNRNIIFPVWIVSSLPSRHEINPPWLKSSNSTYLAVLQFAHKAQTEPSSSISLTPIFRPMCLLYTKACSHGNAK